MAVKDLTTLKADITAAIAVGAARSITPTILQGLLVDTVDSLNNYDNQDSITTEINKCRYSSPTYLVPGTGGGIGVYGRGQGYNCYNNYGDSYGAQYNSGTGFDTWGATAAWIGSTTLTASSVCPGSVANVKRFVQDMYMGYIGGSGTYDSANLFSAYMGGLRGMNTTYNAGEGYMGIKTVVGSSGAFAYVCTRTSSGVETLSSGLQLDSTDSERPLSINNRLSIIIDSNNVNGYLNGVLIGTLPRVSWPTSGVAGFNVMTHQLFKETGTANKAITLYYNRFGLSY